MDTEGLPDEPDTLIEGPWTHRFISANGIRFHVVEAGEGPLVLMLHGFPQFWWLWRDQITALSAAGYRAVAIDLRGYGASDKPPSGYDLYTLAGDVGRLVRALGESDATVVGHDWGGILGWTAATLHPRQVSGLVVSGMSHPLRLRDSMVSDRAQRAATRYAFRFQVPGLGERRVLASDAAWVRQVLHDWSGAAWAASASFPAAQRRYARAIQIPGVAAAAVEYYRWALLSYVRPTGAHLASRLEEGVSCPVRSIHGDGPGPILLSTVRGSERFCSGEYGLSVMPGLGHFLPEEAPEQFNENLLDFLAAHRGNRRAP